MKSTADITHPPSSEDEESEEVVVKNLKADILEKVNKKTRQILSDANFFSMQDSILKSAEKKDHTPAKQSGRKKSAKKEEEWHAELCEDKQHNLRNRSVTKRDVNVIIEE